MLRSLVALLLMVGFYLLALAISGTFLYIAVLGLTGENRNGTGIGFLIVGALSILWSVLPRRDVFVSPGPQIFESDQPELFRLIRDVAAATRQAMPDEVYVTGEVNAWVAHRGGAMGVGTRRVMGLGLPLMQTLTLSQFRSVLAHEFGHYVAGDTKLAPLVYKTREAIWRTIENVSKSSGLLHKPFLWYGNFYLRVTQAISRTQELNADSLAARVAGGRNAAAALESVHRTSLAYEVYWFEEVVPLLDRGYRPPIVTGFTQFLRVAHIDTALKETVQRELREGKGHIHDSHPPLAERIRALKSMRGGSLNGDEPVVTTIVSDIDRLEHGILSALDESAAAGLRAIRWEEAAAVFMQLWREQVKTHAPTLRGIVPGEFSRVAGSLPSFAARLQLTEVPPAERTRIAASVIGCAFAALLHDNGWSCILTPGEPVVMVRGDHAIRPFEVLPRLMSGELRMEEWNTQCRAAGIEQLTLVG